MYGFQLLNNSDNLANSPIGRISLPYVNTAAGAATAQILPLGINDTALFALNTSLWRGAFAVNTTSVSIANATALLIAAGIQPIVVSVRGNVAQYTSRGATPAMLQELRRQPLVMQSSVTEPSTSLYAGFSIIPSPPPPPSHGKLLSNKQRQTRM